MVEGTNASTDQRRKSPRVPLVLAVELSSKEKPGRCGVTRNASDGGLLLVTPSRFEVGEQLSVAAFVGPYQSRIAARVVRVEENELGSAEVWRYRMALSLEKALPRELLDEAQRRGTPSTRMKV